MGGRISRRRRYNLPGFPDVLRGVVEAYRNHRDDVRKNVEKVKTGLQRVGTPQPSDDPLTDRVLDEAAKELRAVFRSDSWWIRRGAEISDGSSAQSVAPSDGSGKIRLPPRAGALTTANHGGWRNLRSSRWGVPSLFGGWPVRLVPHFEKMLYDNAQLVRIYLDGWRLTKEDRFREVVEETLEYVRRECSHSDGAFYAAQDADSEGHEGSYFVWEPKEIASVLGAEMAEQFCQCYGVTESGNFEGKKCVEPAWRGSTRIRRAGGSGDHVAGCQAESCLPAREQRIVYAAAG